MARKKKLTLREQVEVLEKKVRKLTARVSYHKHRNKLLSKVITALSRG